MRRSSVGILGALLIAAASSAPAAALPADECVLLERRARIAALNGDEEGRVELLEQAAEACPREISLLLALERAYRQMDDAREQRARVHRRLVALTEDESALVSLALIDRAIDDELTTDEERALLGRVARRWVERLPGSTRALETLARILAREGELEEARDLVARLIELEDRPEYRANAYYLDRALGRLDEALAYLLSRVEDGDTRVTTQLALISLLAEMGRHEELVARSGPILENQPAFARYLDPFLIPAAWALYDAGENEQAESFFRLLLSKAPAHDELQRTVYHLFSTEEERAEQEAAIEDRWAYERDPMNLLREGTARLSAGDAASAYGLIERATVEAPEWPVGWMNLGVAAIALERWEEAERSLTKALELDPGIDDALYNRGLARVELERYEAALADMLAFLEKNPSRKDAWYYVYRCHRALGNGKAAAEALAKYQ